MDGLLDMVVQSADFDALTATPEMVLEKKKFIGPDGAISVGTMPDRGSPTISLPLNGTASIPAGKYSGGKVTQNIPAMGGYTIYPTSKEQQISTKGVYMGGNIIVPKLSNLVPENIKEGEYVGGVGPGTWKGFVVNDPYTLYYRGTFGPGQSIKILKSYSNSHTVNPTYEEKYIYLAPDGRLTEQFCRFNPIDITGKKTLIIEYTVYLKAIAYNTCYMKPFLTTFDPDDGSGGRLDVLGDKNLLGITTLGRDTKYTAPTAVSGDGAHDGDQIESLRVDVSSFSRTVYLSLYVSMTKYEKYAWFKIHSIKFE